MASIQTAAVNAENDAEWAHHFAGHLKSATGVSAKIVTPPRAKHKARRVEDLRTGVWS